ncbi:hypothetical protein EZS27_000996 [termite gut metagenome]|uniref:Uncharacterized protein n=1 Tax=termite gut metagenome TaxID=433724 RepID=A0A5J4T2D8_9ZZZZ
MDILNLYYDAIRMYNAAAFSFGAKNYISELGLARKFDNLEAIELNKAKYNLMAEKALLDDYEQSAKNFEKEIDKLILESNIIEKSLLDIIIPPNTNFNLTEIIKAKEDDVYNVSINELSIFLTDTYRILISNRQEVFSILKKDIRNLKKKRLFRYTIFFLCPIILLLLVYFVFKFKGIEAPTTIVGAIIIGIISSSIVTLFSSLFDKYKNKRYYRISTLKEELRDKNEKMTRDLITEFKEKNIEKKIELEIQLKQRWLKIESDLFDNLIKATFNDVEKDIFELKIQLKKLIENYKDIFSCFYEKTLSLFNQQEKFTKKIENVAVQIKEDSIKPSFQLMQDTLLEIKTVKNEIEQLKFDI